MNILSSIESIFSSTPQQQAIRTTTALQWFHNRAISYPQNYTFTFQKLQDYINGLDPTFSARFAGTLVVAQNTLSNNSIESVMESIADSAQGKVPSTAGDLTIFFDALAANVLPSGWNASTWISTIGQATSQAVVQVAGLATGAAVLYAIVVLGFLFLMREA